MNFPGLDPTWSGMHHLMRELYLLRLWNLARCRRALEKNEKVLVVATTALGDSLLTLPLIDSLSTALGPERVGVLVREPYAELFRKDGRIGTVFTVSGKYRGVRKLQKALKANPHRIALLANITEPDLIPWLWWSGVRGYLRYQTRWTRYPSWIANHSMLRQPHEEDYATGHAIENNLAMAEALGIPASTHEMSLYGFKKSATNKEGEKLLLIHAGASRSSKRWPKENWVRLADEWIKTYGGAVGLTGSPSEIPLAESIRAQMYHPNKVEILAGKLSLLRLAEKQHQATLFVSGDTGPYHLAVSVGCPTVTLFAPMDRGSSREACGPHQANPKRHRYVETGRLQEAITTLSHDRVWAEVVDLMQEIS